MWKQLWDQWGQIRGNAKWKAVEWLWDHKWSVGIPMVGAFLTTGWSLLVSPLGPMIFVNGLGVFAIGLLIVNEIQKRRLHKKWERGELPSPQDSKQEDQLQNALQTVEKLRAKIAAIEDIRPHLEAEGVAIQRAVPQPIFLHGLPPLLPRKEWASFALLRIANNPRSTNSEAVARDLYASISYFNAQGSKIFPTIQGGWVMPTNVHDPHIIGAILPRWPSLQPHESAHLGIALGYLRDEPFLYSALSDSSPQYADWLDTDLLLDDPQFPIRVHIVLGCHGFQTTYEYRLTISREDKWLVLTPISLPLE